MIEAVSSFVFFLLVAGSLIVWTRIYQRRSQGEPLVPLVPRRPVPWTGIDVLAVFAIFVIAQVAVGQLIGPGAAPALRAQQAPAAVAEDPDALEEADQAADTANAEEDEAAAEVQEAEQQPGSQHLVLLLLEQRPGLFTLLLCALAAVVVAPVVEEFLFRLVLQGWLERKEMLRPGRQGPRPGTFSLVLTAAIFALIHFRMGEPQLEPDRLVRIVLVNALAQVVTLLVGVAWLAFRANQASRLERAPEAGAEPEAAGDQPWSLELADLGIVPEKLPEDLLLGLAAFFAVVIPVYALQYTLSVLLRDSPVAPDPIPLFFFALVLGYLYQRTHRIVPSIVLHFALNATSLLGAWLAAVAERT